MNVVVEIIENQAYISVEGSLDTQTAPDFNSKVRIIDYSKVSKVAMDLKGTRYISSAGLREILMIRKKLKANEDLRILNANDDIAELIQTVGFDSFLTLVRESEKKISKYLQYSLKDILEEKVQTRGDRVFVTGCAEYTWADMERCSQIVAVDLKNMGVKKGTHVGICCGNSVNWLIALFASQKLGAISMLINPALGIAEISEIAQIGEISHMCMGDMAEEYKICSEKLRKVKDSAVRETYDISRTVDFRQRYAEYEGIQNLLSEKVMADDPALVVFSSGSTGKPKGVLLSAYNVLNAANSIVVNTRLTEEDKVCLILPLFHIFALVTGLFANILADATLYLPDNIRTDTIFKALSEERCTVMHSVPTMMLALVNNKNFDASKVGHLRSSILAGAAISPAQMLMLKDTFRNTHFAVAYGLSEIAPVTITEYDETVEHLTTTAGKPCEDIELKIHSMDGAGEGEILLRGYNLMLCYYKLDLNDQAIDEDGWLHTGDLGFLDEEGYLHITGRIKDLIIRGGENIIPNEVASAISEHSSISDVKVMGVPDDFYGEIVVAAICLKQGESFDKDAMNAYLKERIAKYKIPAHYVVYDAFPTLSNGKVDAVNLKKDLIARTKKERE